MVSEMKINWTNTQKDFRCSLFVYLLMLLLALCEIGMIVCCAVRVSGRRTHLDNYNGSNE